MVENFDESSNRWHIGQKVHILAGPFADFKGSIDLIDSRKKKVRVMVNFWGRETPVELNYYQIEPLEK